jgi:AraC-like DNA-binding protein
MMVSSRTEVTVSSAILAAYIQAALKMGLPLDAVETAAGVPLAEMAKPDGRLPMTTYTALSGVLREHFGPAFGLRVAETMTEARVTILAYILANSATLGEAFERHSRYRAIVAETECPVLKITGQTATYGFRQPKSHVMANGPWMEAAVGYWLIRCRHLTGVDWDPLAVHLQSSTTEPEVYARIFRAPVTNNSEDTQLVFSAELLDLPINSPDENLLRYLTPIAEEIVRNLPGGQSLKQKVQEKILALLENGDYSVNAIADQLHISVRTLQRRLEDEGTAFAELLDSTRHIAAQEYLKDPRIAIAEVAYLLGFSESSTFYRAFKRWTSMTPVQFRKSLAP